MPPGPERALGTGWEEGRDPEMVPRLGQQDRCGKGGPSATYLGGHRHGTWLRRPRTPSRCSAHRPRARRAGTPACPLRCRSRERRPAGLALKTRSDVPTLARCRPHAPSHRPPCHPPGHRALSTPAAHAPWSPAAHPAVSGAPTATWQRRRDARQGCAETPGPAATPTFVEVRGAHGVAQHRAEVAQVRGALQ